MKLLVPILLLCLLTPCSSQRNEKEEKICQPFLTSKFSSPLLEGIKRNLRTDEEGEFSCELVLQDRYLPAQIRFTIHEGLYMLAARHIAIGLQRQDTAARHLRVLGQMSPNTFKYAYLEGLFSLDPVVGNPLAAAESLRRALYGVASKDNSTTSEDIFAARVEYFKALALIGNITDAAKEVPLISKENYPLLDFHLYFMLKDVLSIANDTESNKDQCVSDDTVQPNNPLSTVETEIKSFYQLVNLHATNEYDGFVPDLTWKPQVFTSGIDAVDFAEFVNRREPFIISFGGLQKMSSALQWGVHKWTNLSYLLQTVGEEEVVLIEKKVSLPSLSHRPFGLSSLVQRKETTFSSFLLTEQAQAGQSSYLNIQQRHLSEGKYSSPLHKLRQDLSPNISFLEDNWRNVTNVNLWLGGCSSGVGQGEAASRFHFDATDNLYVVLEGQKTFHLLSPKYALETETVAPTYAVSPDGFSYQFNANHFLEFYRKKYSETGRNLSAKNDGNRIFSARILGELRSRNTSSYETINNHFSTISEPEKKEGLADKIVSFSLRPGDMLYLPTGWFHKVISQASPASDDGWTDGQQPLFPNCVTKHLALNFWWKAKNWEDAEAYEKAASERLFTELFQTIFE